jgi:transcriptional regulator with XRE-family HTH domain
MAVVKKNRKGSKPSKAAAAKIAAFRKAKNWTAQALAEKLGLSGPNIVYAWEGGSYEPSAQNYISMANLASPDWRYIEWFLRRAGVEDKTLKQAADMLMHSSQVTQVLRLGDALREELSDMLNVAIEPLDHTEGQKLMLPTWALPNPASTRYVHIDGKGDLIFIDTIQTDVRELAEGSLVAIDSGIANSPLIGVLRKQSAGHNIEHYMLRPIDNATGDVFIGSSVSARPPELTRKHLILGRVMVWIQTGEKK